MRPRAAVACGWRRDRCALPPGSDIACLLHGKAGRFGRGRRHAHASQDLV